MKVVVSIIVAVGLLLLLLPDTAHASFSCPTEDGAGFPLGEHDESINPIFCSFPALPGENPLDFYCKYDRNTGALVQDHDAGFCPGTASGTPPGFMCPPEDGAGFALGERDESIDPMFCSYPAFPGENPLDFYCKYDRNTGVLVEDHDAGFCPGTAPGAAPSHAAPQGTDKVVTTNEDTAYTFTVADFGFSDPNDTPADALQAVKITTLPALGSLTNNNAAVTAGAFIPVADIAGNKLKFTPALNASGTGYASFTFQVQDNGGTANGGVDTDQSANTMTINVTAVNDAPAGTDASKTIFEEGSYTFAAVDFGFTDPNDSPANTFTAVKITTLPGAGSLTLSAGAVTAGQSIPAANIPNLLFTPAANGNGSPYATFTFQVQDNGGVINAGIDLDASANTFRFDVSPVNDPPSGADKAVSIPENTAYVFTATDFTFTDLIDAANGGANSFLAVKIASLPAVGSLTNNNVAVTAGQFVSVTDINNNLFKFTPVAGALGSPYATFTFQVQDNGGVANSGIDLDQSANTITVNVLAVNDPPQGADKAVTTDEDTAYTFTGADFGFSDPLDAATGANNLLAVRITTLPAAGTLTNNNVAVTAGQFVSVTDVTAGKLKFTPAANASGANYASFTFQVQDDGGTTLGGVDLDQSPNTITVHVTSVNDAPSGADASQGVTEGTPITLAAGAFGFTDPNDSPANALLAVKITTLPGAGTLTNNNVAITAGDSISFSDLNGNKLKFTPAPNGTGSPYASFTFQVQDNGGVLNGGLDLDQSPNIFTINISNANDAPSGTDKAVTTPEDTAYTFLVADFGFTDPDNSPPNALLAVQIVTLPSVGSLTNNGMPVTGGQFISVVDITGNLLKLTPAANASGSPYTSFTFRVQDDGGTASGVDLAQSSNTMTVNVTSANDPPTDITLVGATIPENSSNGTVVGTLSATDADTGDSATFTLTNNAGGRFTIVGNQLRVANSTLLDFETTTSHNITVQVADGANVTFSKPFTITVTDVTDPPSAPDATSPGGTISTQTPTFGWTGLTGPVTGYALYDLAPNGQYALVKTYTDLPTICPGGNCSVNSPVPLMDGHHTFWIIAWNGTGWGQWSNPRDFCINFCGLPVPARVTLVSPTGAIGGAAPTFTWNALSTPPLGYALYDLAPNGQYDLVTTYSPGAACSGATCTATAPSALADGHHTWWIIAFNGAGWGQWSDGLLYCLNACLPIREGPAGSPTATPTATKPTPTPASTSTPQPATPTPASSTPTPTSAPPAAPNAPAPPATATPTPAPATPTPTPRVTATPTSTVPTAVTRTATPTPTRTPATGSASTVAPPR